MSQSNTPSSPAAASHDAERAEKIARLKAAVQSGTYNVKSRELVLDLLKPIADWID